MTLLSIQLGIDPDNRYVGYSTRESLKLGPKILLPQSPVEIFKPLKLRHLRLPRGGRSIRPGRASARSSSISSDEEYSEVGAHPDQEALFIDFPLRNSVERNEAAPPVRGSLIGVV